MEIQGSGEYWRYRQMIGMTFGSKEWNEYYHGGRAPKRKGAIARRLAMPSVRKTQAAAHELAMDDWAAQLAWEAGCAGIVQAYQSDLQGLGTVARSTAAKDHALTVQVHPLTTWPEGITEELQAAGFAWSSRKGGFWWAHRSPETCATAARICSGQVLEN
jgi:hypothetical protein